MFSTRTKGDFAIKLSVEAICPGASAYNGISVGYIPTLPDMFKTGLLSAAVLGRRMVDPLASSASCNANTALNRVPEGADDGRGVRSSLPPSESGRESPAKSRFVNIVDVEVKLAESGQTFKLVQVLGSSQQSDREAYSIHIRP